MPLLDAALCAGSLLVRLYEAACFMLELHFAVVSALLAALRALLALPASAVGFVTSGALEATAACARLVRAAFALLGGVGAEWLGATRAALAAAPAAAVDVGHAVARLPVSAALGFAGGVRAAADALESAEAALRGGLGAAAGFLANALGAAVAAAAAVVTNSAHAVLDALTNTVSAGGGAVTVTAASVTTSLGGAVTAAMSAVTDTVGATLGAVTHSVAAVTTALNGVVTASVGAITGTVGAVTALFDAAVSCVDVTVGTASSTVNSFAGATRTTLTAVMALPAATVDFSLLVLTWPFQQLSYFVRVLTATLTLQALFVTAVLICLSSWYLSPQLRRQLAAMVEGHVPRVQLRLLSAVSRFVFANLAPLLRSRLRRTTQAGHHRQRFEAYPAPAPLLLEFEPPAARRDGPWGDPGPPRVDAPHAERRPRPDERREEEEEEEEVAAAAAGERVRQRNAATRDGSGDASGVSQEREQQEAAREEENMKICVICQDQPKGTVLLPCRHLCLCSDCARTIMRGPFDQQKCPLCRKNIVHTMDVYM